MLLLTNLPLYGGGSGVRVYFYACVYSSVICCSPLGGFRPSFRFPRLTLGFRFVPLGSPWSTLGSFGFPWIALICLRPYSRLTRNSDVQFRANSSPVRCLCRTKWHRGIYPQHLRITHNPNKVVQGPQLQTPLQSISTEPGC